MQMIASYFSVDARVRAADGISNAPGTRTTAMSFLTAPVRNKPSQALSKSRSVIKALKRETTIANRFPEASSFPAIPETASSGTGPIFNVSSLSRFLTVKVKMDPHCSLSPEGIDVSFDRLGGELITRQSVSARVVHTFSL